MKKPCSFSIEEEVLKQLKEFCDERSMSKSSVISACLHHYMSSVKQAEDLVKEMREIKDLDPTP